MYAIGGKSEITIPENLYIIGTMNTADRSVGHIDYAIQRRFAFVEMLPRELNEADLDKGQSFKSEEFHQIQTLFKNHVSSEFEDRIQDVQIGHSYFIHDSKKVDDFNIRLKYEVAPILEEYVKDGILKNDEEVKRIIDKYKA
jgi:5-methylcytosine-specific restriction endonuclease McrBC GTP-binding regulatory subunit McrB